MIWWLPYWQNLVASGFFVQKMVWCESVIRKLDFVWPWSLKKPINLSVLWAGLSICTITTITGPWGEYALPKPVVLSPHGLPRVQEDLGVNVTLVGEDAYMVQPQHWSMYRPLGRVEEMYLRDMEGETVSHEQNPGIRVEPEFVSLGYQPLSSGWS